MKLSRSMIATLHGVRAAELDRRPLLRTQVDRRHRHCLGPDGAGYLAITRDRPAVVVTTEAGRHILDAYEAGRGEREKECA